MNYIEQGNGNPIILLHGFCEDHRLWKDLGSQLAQNYTVIMPDLPGFGQSPVIESDLEKWAAELHEKIVKRECPEGAVIIGHSMGGYLALAYASLYPEFVKGLGLFHSNSKADNEEKKLARTRNIAFVKDHGVKAFVKQLIPGLFAPEADRQMVQKALDMAMDGTPPGIIFALEAMRDRPDRGELLKTVEYPVLVIAGEKDTIMPREVLAEIASYPSTCLFRVLQNSGHMRMFEEPSESLKAVTDYLELIRWS